MFKALNDGKWSSLTEVRLNKSVEFDFVPRAHYNYKKKGNKDSSQTGNNDEEEQEDDLDDEQDVEDLEESPPHIPARLVPAATATSIPP
jgi:hypothetical protein